MLLKYDKLKTVPVCVFSPKDLQSKFSTDSVLNEALPESEDKAIFSK